MRLLTLPLVVDLSSQGNAQSMESSTPNDQQIVQDLREALSASGWTDDSPASQTSQRLLSAPEGTTEAPIAPETIVPPVDEPLTAPPVGQSQDTSFVPEQFADEFASISPDLSKWLKNGVEIKATLTKKTQEFADYKRQTDAELEALRGDAMFTRRLKADKEASKALADFVATRDSRGNSPASQDDSTEDDIDILSLSPAEYKAHQKKLREHMRAEAREEALKAVHERYVAPVERQNALSEKLRSKFVVEMGLSPAVVEKAANLAAAHAQKWKLQVSADNAIDLVSDFLEQAKSSTNESTVAPVTQAPTTVTTPPVRRVATPPMGAGGIPPVPVPSSMRDGRAPANRNEFHKQVMSQLSRELGTEVTKSDLRDILFNTHS